MTHLPEINHTKNIIKDSFIEERVRHFSEASPNVVLGLESMKVTGLTSLSSGGGDFLKDESKLYMIHLYTCDVWPELLIEYTEL